MVAISADVGGTVDNQSRPVAAPKMRVAAGVGGTLIKPAIATARAK
jgi:hypothetical protein